MAQLPKKVAKRQLGQVEPSGRPGDGGGSASLKPWKEWLADWEAKVRYDPTADSDCIPTTVPPHSDLWDLDQEHDEGLPAGHGYIDRWEWEKERHEAFTLERG